MNIVVQPTAAAFWQSAGDLLAQDVAHNTLVIGAQAHMAARGLHDGEQLFTIEDGERTIGCATLMTTRTVFLSVMPEVAAGGFAAWLRERGIALAGVVGRRDLLHAFTEVFDRNYTVHDDLLLYRLIGEPEFGPARGAPQLATENDLPTLLTWFHAFERETERIPSPEPLEARVMRLVDAGELMLWYHEGAVVSMAACRTLPLECARIGPVYTPPHLRGRGFAQAATAAACSHAQRERRRTVFLFADAQFAPSNRCYQRVGFARIGEHAHLLFPDGNVGAVPRDAPR